jgi:hypothetical protein
VVWCNPRECRVRVDVHKASSCQVLLLVSLFRCESRDMCIATPYHESIDGKTSSMITSRVHTYISTHEQNPHEVASWTRSP